MSGLSEREKNQHLLDDQRKSKLQENRFSRATDLSKSTKQRSRPGRNLHLSQGRLIPKFTHLRQSQSNMVKQKSMGFNLLTKMNGDLETVKNWKRG